MTHEQQLRSYARSCPAYEDGGPGIEEALHAGADALARVAALEHHEAEAKRLGDLLKRLNSTTVDHAADAQSWQAQCELRDAAIDRLTARVTALEAALAQARLDHQCSEGVLSMTVHRLEGIVEGNPTGRHNFLQRIDELRKIEAEYAAVKRAAKAALGVTRDTPGETDALSDLRRQVTEKDAQLAELREQLSEANESRDLYEQQFMDVVEVASVFQAGEPLGDKIVWGQRTTVDGFKWLLAERATYEAKLTAADQRLRHVQAETFTVVDDEDGEYSLDSDVANDDCISLTIRSSGFGWSAVVGADKGYGTLKGSIPQWLLDALRRRAQAARENP